jgi:hypothetical protein
VPNRERVNDHSSEEIRPKMRVLTVHIQVTIDMPDRDRHGDDPVFLDDASRTVVIAVSPASVVVAMVCVMTVRARAMIVVRTVVPANAAPIGLRARRESGQCQHNQPHN